MILSLVITSKMQDIKVNRILCVGSECLETVDGLSVKRHGKVFASESVFDWRSYVMLV